MQGDSIFSDRDIIQPFAGGAIGIDYERIALGTSPNVQPWSPSQDSIVIEQDFWIAQEFYRPLPLNTPYDAASFSQGWVGVFADTDRATTVLGACVLVWESPLMDRGGGICVVRRRWASIPPTRNAVEQFAYSFVGFDDDSAFRERKSVAVNSRLQYDYLIFDDLGILSGLLATFPAGPRLDSTTGLYPEGLIIPEQKYYGESTSAELDSIDDQTPTVPSFSQYVSWCGVGGAEIVAEASTLNRWMGNIFERRTRFVLAQ